MKQKTVPRRGFLKSIALAAGPLILPTGAFGRDGLPGANSKIVTGHIGVGARGRQLLAQLQASVGAVCDVDSERLRLGAGLTSAGTRAYADYREILARKDIDAVVIATPDHWHAVQAVHACEAGKDVYLETPVCRSPIAARALVRAAARFGTVLQTGTMARSTPAFAAVRQWVAESGPITEAHCWGLPAPALRQELIELPPSTLRWEAWLGPAPARPYAHAFVEDGWRWRLDYGGGQIMRQGAQLFECVLEALDVSLDTNLKVSVNGTAPTDGGDCPQTFTVTIELEKPALKLTWSQEPPAGQSAPGFELRSEKGTLTARGLGLDMAVDIAVIDKLPEEQRRKPAEPLHDWLVAVERRSTPAASLAHGVLAATAASLANLSYRLDRPLAWDHASGACANDDVANRMLAEPGSGPWRI